MGNTTPKEDPVLQRLDTLIRLQARIAVAHLDTQKDKILFLASAGLGPKATGEILGISANSVSVSLLQARKKKGTPKSKDAEDSV